jgi:hypothetical protein
MDPIPPEQLAALAKEDRGPLTKSIVVAFTCIAGICVALRIITRLRFLGRSLGWEDYAIVVSMALAIATGVLQVMRKTHAALATNRMLTQSRGGRWQRQACSLHRVSRWS